MENRTWIYDDGGRSEAGYKGTTGDCVCRAIAIATETPYQEVYDLINEFAKRERTGKRKKGVSSARTDATNPAWIEAGRAVPYEFGVYPLTEEDLQYAELCGKEE